MKLYRVMEMIKKMERHGEVSSWVVVDESGNIIYTDTDEVYDMYTELLVKSIEDGCWIRYGAQIAIIIY